MGENEKLATYFALFVSYHTIGLFIVIVEKPFLCSGDYLKDFLIE
jgi:hypothetical protein